MSASRLRAAEGTGLPSLSAWFLAMMAVSASVAIAAPLRGSWQSGAGPHVAGKQGPRQRRVWP